MVKTIQVDIDEKLFSVLKVSPENSGLLLKQLSAATLLGQENFFEPGSSICRNDQARL